jgi:DNA (cytosine-5)-methyltransferase 1
MSDAVLSLFSGAGGMSLGFAEAGLKPIFALDIEPAACATYSQNLEFEAHCADLVADFEKIERALRQWPKPLALIGGPPCQGFSSAGLKRANDPRNRLIFSYFRLVEILKPRWFFFENVEGLLTSNEGRSISELVRQFIAIGYVVRLQKVNFAVYGIPQSRKRVVVIGNNIGADFEFPIAAYRFESGKHYHRDALPFAPTIEDALRGLGACGDSSDLRSEYSTSEPNNPYDEIMRSGNRINSVSLHYYKSRTNEIETYKRLGPGQSMKDLPEYLWPASFRRRAFRRVMDGTPSERRGGAPSGIKRLVGAQCSLTITSAATREFVHPVEDRPLTLREAARLQSFPDRFEFIGNESQIATQIGNAFPPMAAATFAKLFVKIEGSAGVGTPKKPGDNTGRLLGYRLTASAGKSPALESTDALLRGLVNEQKELPLSYH